MVVPRSIEFLEQVVDCIELKMENGNGRMRSLLAMQMIEGRRLDQLY